MAQFDLGQDSNLGAVVQDHRHWSLVLEKLSRSKCPRSKPSSRLLRIGKR